jgi:dTDP-4-dehydrorhamnose reductase
MKYLISGAGGQLGREWIRLLDETASGDEFTALKHSDFDITDLESVKKTLKHENPDVLINCAAYTNVDGAENDQEKADLINHIAVKNLAAECADADIKLVHYSTDYVFPGRDEDEQKYPDGYPEDGETGPVNVYGKTKLAGEEALEWETNDYLLIRVSWLCGSDGKNFVKTMLRLGSERNEVSVVDDQIGSPAFTFDVAEKTRKLVQKGKTGIYHISSDGKITWADFAEEIFELAGFEVAVKRVTSADFKTVAKRPVFSLLSKSKIADQGMTPVPWRSGLSELLNRLKMK